MWTPVLLTAALALGQPGVTLPTIAPTPAPNAARRRPNAALSAARRWTPAAAATQPPPAGGSPRSRCRSRRRCCRLPPRLLLRPPPPPRPPRRCPLVLNEGTPGHLLGSQLDGNNIAVYGWVEGSGTPSSAGVSNEPMAWNDRANRVLLQQFFFRVESTVVTTGTTMPTWGFRVDTACRLRLPLHAAARHLQQPARLTHIRTPAYRRTSTAWTRWSSTAKCTSPTSSRGWTSRSAASTRLRRREH